MMAYLAMMAPRLVELHRVLKSTGSFYLYCDDVASHYLKLVPDLVGRACLPRRDDPVWRFAPSRKPRSSSAKAFSCQEAAPPL
jgi:hypothetical protein